MLDWLVSKVTEAGQQFRSKYLIQTTPNNPQTSSNLTVVCYRDQSRRNVVPIRVRWFRIKNGQQNEIASMKGSTYPCQPSDLGCTIRAQVQTLEQEPPETNNIIFGPIRMDINLKNILTGILSTGHSSFTAFVVNGGLQKQVKLKIADDMVSLTQPVTSRHFDFQFTLSQPRTELNPKDISRLYVRFRDQEKEQQLKTFLNSIFEYEPEMERSNRSSGISRSVFRVDGRLQLRFLTRNNRDLLLFTIKAFAAQRDMKACSVIQKIQRIDLTKQDLFHTFFQFESLRADMLQMHQLNQTLAIDRDKKLRDLRNLQDEIGSMRASFEQIINKQLMEKNIDINNLNQSYSRVSQRADQLQNRKRVRELEDQKERLELRVKVLMDEVDTLKFFKNPNNQSLLSEQVSVQKKNPFQKKKIVLQKHPQIRQLKPSLSMLEVSKVHANGQDGTTTAQPKSMKMLQQKSLEMENILKDLHDPQQRQLDKVKQQFTQLKEKYEMLQEQYEKLANQPRPEHNDSSMNISHTNINQSMTSEAGMNLLMEKIAKMNDLQQRLLKDNEKMEIEINSLKEERHRLQSQIQKLRTETQASSMSSSPSHLIQQIQQLHDEKRNLMRKIDLISAEASKVKSQLVLQKRIQELQQIVRNGNRKIVQLQQQLAHNKSNSHNLSYSRLWHENDRRMKEINQGLLKQIEQLKTKLQKQKNGQILLSEVDENSQLRQRVVSQLETIEKLKTQLHQKQRSQGSSDGSAKKYQRKIKQLEQQLNIVKRSAETINRSRDLSMSLEQYHSQEIDRLRAEADLLKKENEKISEMCEKYAKQAKQGQKARLQNMALKKELAEMKQK